MPEGTKTRVETKPKSEGGDVFADGPINKKGEWSPKGGRESYFHAHLSELDDEGESEPELDVFEEEDLDVGDLLVTEQETLIASDTEVTDSAWGEQLERVALVLGELVLREPPVATKGNDVLHFREDGSIVRRTVSGDYPLSDETKTTTTQQPLSS